ncbi:MAG: hypothetical protein IIB94_10635 [Candidatus Marinimicrobia bacterium]|nr:hypothetical protein [Candidatus Neomarinimicrobiota bacterium]
MSEIEAHNNEDGFYSTYVFQGILNQVEMIMKHRKVLIITFLLYTVPAFFILLFSEPYYTSSVTILPPESSSSGGVLSSFQGAASSLFGINPSSSPDVTLLYDDIIRSRRVSRNILMSEFQTVEFDEPIKLIDYFRIVADSESELLQRATKVYNGMISIIIDPISKKSMIMVTTPEAQLSADIANQLVFELDKFNTELATEKAVESRVFIEGRLTTTKLLLRGAEEAVKEFRENNKRIENSPQLQLEQGRLVREVRIQEEVFITLKKELETVKIEEVKNLPSVRVLDEAIAPYTKTGPLRRKAMLIAMVVAFALGIGMTYLWEFTEKASSDSGISNSIKKLWNILKGDVTNAGTMLNFKNMRNKTEEQTFLNDE